MGLIEGTFEALPKRRISEETCRKFGYRIGEYQGRPAHLADYRDQDGRVVAQHIRLNNPKDFRWVGEADDVQLFGQHLWGPGKMVVVTEGEIDALSVSQQQGNKWPVVSIPSGAKSAAKAIKRNLAFFDQYETVVLMFDMDEPGKEAVEECAPLFTPGKCKVAQLPLKDPSELLQAGRGAEIISAIWNAKVWRPDGIVSGTELWEEVSSEDTAASLTYPWGPLTSITMGLRRSELVTLTAGSGIGKSAVCREIAYHLLQQGETVGYIALEESVKRTALGLMGIAINKPLHLTRDGVSEEELKNAFTATVGSGRCYLYDHFGSTDLDNLLARVRYLSRSCDCRWIVLDHLSIVVSGLGDGDERRLIDNAMTALRTLVQETGIGLILVSHLKRPEGRGHEEGAVTSLGQLRGSHAIAQLSDMVIGLERNQQGDDPDLTTLRVLKNRFTGETGIAGALRYDRATGRLNEAELPGEDSDDNPF